MTRRKLIAGNWKMNGLNAALAEITAIGAGVAALGARAPDVLVCPPFTLISSAARGEVAIGAQDCHIGVSGAHTGDISSVMLKDAGAGSVIVGHSERRADHGEDDALVRAKAEAALAAGLRTIICVGETRAEREAGTAYAVVARQIAGSVPFAAQGTIVIAYEPVWAIGTGLTPTNDDIAAMHGAIRAELARSDAARAAVTQILYGGSVKPGNAREILALADVDGALVGGASLKAADFLGIINACV
ncbi:MAG: triose-phosphate isomerase [Hyphomicrobiales bacterium]|nr:triose-phosphate isomerase [Hyphomicrobiales bacterium]